MHERLARPILHRPCGDEVKAAKKIFTTLWRTGEVALLCGAPGVGKSMFAVRLAEAIARGTSHLLTEEYLHIRSPEGGLAPALDPSRVFYIDLQRTASQFNERFPDVTIERRHLDWDSFDFRDNDSIRAARVQSSIRKVIDEGAEVVILDDISLGGINIGRPNGPLRTLRTLKMFAAEHGTSFLVIAGSRPHKRPRPASLSDVAFRHIAEQADSVFCLSASTYGPAFRYICHLRSTSGLVIHDASAVLTFLIYSGSPPYEGGVDAASADGVVLGSTPAREGLDPDLSGDGVVLSSPEFKYLGDCEESEHLRDYASEALRKDREEKRRLKRSWKQSNKEFLVDGMLNGSYKKYLKGE